MFLTIPSFSPEQRSHEWKNQCKEGNFLKAPEASRVTVKLFSGEFNRQPVGRNVPPLFSPLGHKQKTKGVSWTISLSFTCGLNCTGGPTSPQSPLCLYLPTPQPKPPSPCHPPYQSVSPLTSPLLTAPKILKTNIPDSKCFPPPFLTPLLQKSKIFLSKALTVMTN